MIENIMKRIFGIFSAIVLVFPVSAQDYYTGKSTVTADGITFVVSNRHYIFSLDNVDNVTDTRTGRLSRRSLPIMLLPKLAPGVSTGL